jgi:A/G-specific adenine glycosylase
MTMESCKVGYPLIIRVNRKRGFTAALMDWYRAGHRDLPWRQTTDPYKILVSEIMLQQTRVETVIPYYERFLAEYPDAETLAASDEQRLLSAWAGLGYYTRARNLQKAARQVVAAGGFPRTYEEIRSLPGVGEYTAAAVASIAFNLPHAALDGNALRVLARSTNDAGEIGSRATRSRLAGVAAARLELHDPGSYNQAVMELGATICTPSDPKCLVCPVAGFCEGRRAGRERELPVKSRNGQRRREYTRLLIVERDLSLLVWQRPATSKRLAGFWELPQPSMLPGVRVGIRIGEFEHSITNTSYTIAVHMATVRSIPSDVTWVPVSRLTELPLSTIARKAIALWKAQR